MRSRIKLKEIVDAIDMQPEESSTYLHRPSGKIILLSDEEFSAADGEEPLSDYPAWQREMIEVARQIRKCGADFAELPTKYEVDEWRIMERFSRSLVDREVGDLLDSAIRGRGAFRFFRAEIRRLGVEEHWHRYREATLRRVAEDWCAECAVDYDDTE